MAASTVADDPSALKLHSPSGRVVLLAWLVVIVLFRVAYAVLYRVNTDEPQHLHVVWAWVHGLVPYRDVFDNHAPLFHLLFAPALALFGERPDILLWMRLAQIPLALMLLFSVYLLARTVLPERTAAWAAVAAGLDPTFLPRTVEFRTDNLWAALWILALATLLGGRPTRRRLLLFGLILGAAFAVSLKTLPLLVAAAIAAMASGASTSVTSRRDRLVQLRDATPFVLGGAVVLPALLLAWFGSRSALRPLYYCLVEHNIQARSAVGLRPLILGAGALTAVIVAAPLLARCMAYPGRESRATFLLIGGLTYLVLLWCFWPIVTRQDYMPLEPQIWLFGAPLIVGVAVSRRHAANALLVIEAALVALSIPPLRHWDRSPQHEAALLADVLRLTEPEDTVIDMKGETVYRRRASYYIFETITRRLLESGRLPDDTPERLVSARTFVAVEDDWAFPVRTREFLNTHYLRAGHLRVAGAMLNPSREGAAEGFEIAIPGQYAVVTSRGPAVGLLDGCDVHAAIDLAAGHHVFVLDGAPEPIAVLWARAWYRGFTPFRNGERPHG